VKAVSIPVAAIACIWMPVGSTKVVRSFSVRNGETFV